jgi:hypothetical protein
LEDNTNPPPPVVHVLVAEPFFWGKVESTLRALEKVPVSPDWEGDIEAQLKAQRAIAAVVDLENEEVQAKELLRFLLAQPENQGLSVLAYASYDREDLLNAAAELGATAVARSTFASSLVRLLQELCEIDDDGEGQASPSAG